MKMRVVVGVILGLAFLNLIGFGFVWQKYQPAPETIALTLQPSDDGRLRAVVSGREAAIPPRSTESPVVEDTNTAALSRPAAAEFTTSSTTDSDGDGLTDDDEAYIYLTNPTGDDTFYCDWNQRYSGSDSIPDGYDSDCDGVPDGVEEGMVEPNNPEWIYPGKEFPFSDPQIVGYPYRPSYAYLPDGDDVDTLFDSVDSDGDGLYDHQEYYDETPCAGAETVGRPVAATPYMCLPNLTQTVSFPVNEYLTNPTYYNEIGNPLQVDGMDTDNDGLTDTEETNGFMRGPFSINRQLPMIYTYYTHPSYADGDQDDLIDGTEVNTIVYGGYTDPQNEDTDGDGLSDYDELQSPPNGYGSNPLDNDSDYDNLTDDVELTLNTHPDYASLGYSPSMPNRANTDGGVGGSDLDSDGFASTGEIPDPIPSAAETFSGETLIDPNACQDMNDGYEIEILGTNPTSLDTDGDGLSDCYEVDGDLSPTDPDTDADGYTDGNEVAAGSDPHDPTSVPNSMDDTDTDGLEDWWEHAVFGSLNQVATGDPDTDGCDNLCEYRRGTDPTNPDTDGDGLLDNDELPNSSPTRFDTDEDGLNDGYERNYIFTLNGITQSYRLDARNRDTDGDNIDDDDEVDTSDGELATNAGLADTDSDGLFDLLEIEPMNAANNTAFNAAYVYRNLVETNPLLQDTDSDGWTDFEEIQWYYIQQPNPTVADTDSDGLTDSVEGEQAFTKVNDTDTDNDNLTDGQEYLGFTMTINFCTASGGVQNVNILGYSVNNLTGLNPNSQDSDGDGLLDGVEVNTHDTNPQRADTDDDAFSDSYELSIGSNPLCATIPVPIEGTATATGYRSIQISWEQTDPPATSYAVEYSSNGIDNWTLVTSVSSGTIANHTVLLCNHTYYYRIRPLFNGNNIEGYNSDVFTATTLACPALSTPPAPTISGTIQRNSLNILVAADTSGEIQTLYLEQQAESAWEQVATFTSSGGIYNAANLTCGTSYNYRVRGYRVEANSYSPYSTELVVTTASCQALSANTVALYRNGVWIFRTLDTETTTTVLFGSRESGWTPIIGNWNGGGADGLGLYRSGLFVLRNTTNNGTVDRRFRFGPQEAGWQPLVGDWNGDGVETVGVYKDGLFLLTNSPDGTGVNYRFRLRNDSGWQVIGGDWDGDGADSVGLYRDGSFYITNTLDGRGLRRPFRFGPTVPGWIPFAGDWDANATATIGVYREGIWRLRNSNTTGSVDIGFTFGPREAGWYPLASYRGSTATLAIFAADNAVFSESIERPILPEATLEAIATELPLEPEITPFVELTPEVTVEITAEVAETRPIMPEPTTVLPTVAATPEIVEPTLEPEIIVPEPALPTLEPVETTEEAQ